MHYAAFRCLLYVLYVATVFVLLWDIQDFGCFGSVSAAWICSFSSHRCLLYVNYFGKHAIYVDCRSIGQGILFHHILLKLVWACKVRKRCLTFEYIVLGTVRLWYSFNYVVNIHIELTNSISMTYRVSVYAYYISFIPWIFWITF